MVELYSPTDKKAKPIKVEITETEKHQVILNTYKNVDTHPTKERRPRI